MKFFRLLFIGYLVALSVYPCYEQSCESDMCVAKETDSPANEDEHADLCSPFCLSTCCAMVLGVAHVHEATESENSNTLQFAYTFRFAPLVLITVWQPPRLA